MKRYILFFILLIFIAFVSEAQEVRFVQRDFAPMRFNPAAPATFSHLKLMMNYKLQRYNPAFSVHNTSLTGLYPIMDKNNGFTRAGIGFAFMDEKESALQGFSRQSLDMSFAYAIQLNARNLLAFGLQAAYRQEKIATGGFTTESQWLPNVGFDPNRSTGEVFVNEFQRYFDAGAGAIWYALDPQGGKKVYVSAAVYRLNRPSVYYISDKGSTALPVRSLLSAGFTAWANETFRVKPDVFYMQEGTNQLWSAGTSVHYHFQNNNPYDPIQNGNLQLNTRYDQYGVLSFGFLFSQPQYEVGFNYDLPTRSNNGATTTGNAIELVFSLRKAISRKAPKSPTKRRSNPLVNPSKKADERKKGNENKKTEEKVQLILRKDFNYKLNDVSLNEEAKKYLEDIYLLMTQNKEMYLEVVGHTDNQGSSSANRKISYKRAREAVKYLEEKGISALRMRAVGKSYFDPVDSNDTEEGRKKNRRVEFVFFTK